MRNGVISENVRGSGEPISNQIFLLFVAIAYGADYARAARREDWLGQVGYRLRPQPVAGRVIPLLGPASATPR